MTTISKTELIEKFNELEHNCAGCFSGRNIFLNEYISVQICRIVPIGNDPIYLWTSPSYESDDDMQFETAQECIDDLLSFFDLEDLTSFMIDETETFDTMYVKPK